MLFHFYIYGTASEPIIKKRQKFIRGGFKEKTSRWNGTAEYKMGDIRCHLNLGRVQIFLDLANTVILKIYLFGVEYFSFVYYPSNDFNLSSEGHYLGGYDWPGLCNTYTNTGFQSKFETFTDL